VNGAARRRATSFVPLLLAGALLSGCASIPEGVGSSPQDPWERYNRHMDAFNDGLDRALIKPAAQAYDAAMPLPVRVVAGNFLGNLADAWVGVNSLLQGKVGDGASDFGRVLVNSTVGILGFFDVATPLGLERHNEDFGQTLGTWGVGDGPYVVLPFFGPRTVRDSGGLLVDTLADPLTHQDDHIRLRNTISAVRLLETRAEFLPADKVIEQAATDRYAYLRDAYLQRRRSLIYDGRPPREDLFEE
jgi:phospholipid-binding lipoprotein MlaA